MPATVKAIVKRDLLTWARKSARLSIGQAAQKAQVNLEQLESWENGDDQPTIAQLRKLGRVYKRPLAVFYLPKPPKTFQALHDFRRLPEEQLGRESPELAFEVRRARYRREIALDLYRELMGEEPKPFPGRARLDENTEAVATRLLEMLGIGRDEVASWKTGYDALNRWRGALEEVGVLVFQAKDVDVSEMRGFSISEPLFPVIVANIADALPARIFSMLHETAHLMLREAGLCDLREEAGSAPQRVEVFCNRVAGAALLPKAWLLAEDVVRDNKGARWSDEALQLLAQRYRVSREAVVRRLLVLGRTTEDFYRKKRRELQAAFEAQQEEEERRKALGLERAGFAPPDRMVVSTAGAFFVRLVLNSYHQEKITSNDLASFLEVRLKHVPKIEQAVLGRPVGSAAHA
jgi:Zn-dependent peptidase ImmA (M78 family)/transcriptional regulator with XRE-family HTH domain